MKLGSLILLALVASACSPTLALPVASPLNPEPVCSGPGLRTVVQARPDDRAHPVWAERAGASYAVEWPSGFAVRFLPRVQVLDRAGEVVIEEGQDLMVLGDAGYLIACPYDGVIRIMDFVSAQADPAGAGEARAIAFRKEFGLASDLATVRRVAGDPSNSLEFGVPLAPEEVAELLRRQEVASQREPLIAALAKDPRFGGLYVVQAEGGRIHIRVTRSDAALADLVESLLPPGGSYVFEPAEFTMAELTTVRLDIEADFNSLRAEFGVKHLGVDPVANRVEIGIHPYSEKVAADLVDRYGQQVRVVTSEP